MSDIHRAFDVARANAELDRHYAEGGPQAVEAFLGEQLARAEEEGSSEGERGLWARNELGSFLRGAGRLDESAAAFRSVIDCLSACGPERAEELAIAYNNIGGTYRLAGRDAEALEAFEEGMRILSGLENFSSYTYASLLNNVALLLETKGRSADAEAYLRDAMRLMEARGQLLPLAISQTNLANIFLRRRSAREARPLLEAAEALFARHFAGDYHRAACFAVRGSLQAMENDPEAIASFREAARLIHRYYGPGAEYRMMEKNIDILLRRFGPPPCQRGECPDSGAAQVAEAEAAEAEAAGPGRA